MKIVNIKRFFTSIFLFFSLMISIIFLIGNVSFSHQDLVQKEIFVAKGDTLWSIARSQQEENPYYSQMDIRDIIYEIEQVNQLEKNHHLMEGEKLIIYAK